MKAGARRRTISSDLRSPPQHPVQTEINDQVNDQFEYGKQKRPLEQQQQQQQQQSINDGDYAGNEYDEEENEDYEEDDQSGDVAVDGNGVESKGEEERPKLAEGFYEIETVRRKRIRKGETQYLIKWQGWPESANTWEPVENLKSCSDFIDAFEERSGKRKRRRRSSMGPTPQSKKKQNQPPHQRSPTATIPSITVQEPKTQEPKIQDKSDQKLSSPTTQENTTDFTINIQENHQVENGTRSGTEVLRVSPRIGAKRRKSFAVKRFKQEPKMVAKNDAVVEDVIKDVGVVRCNEMKGISGNVNVAITKILKPVNYSTSILKGEEDVSVSFLVLRSDGEEVVVDNKYLKDHNPLLLINFYEQHLRYSSPSE